MMRAAMLLASVIIVLSALYLGWELVAGWRQLRREGARLGDQAHLGFGDPHVPTPTPGWFVYIVVPALNESAVISRTVSGLAGGPNSHLIVVDDGSDDETGTLALDAGGSGTTVLRRDLPTARQGKGAALNAAYRWLVGDSADRGLDPARVIVCVMDADGRLSNGALAAVLPKFDDPRVGAAQLSVRIRNRDHFLTQYQDYLFWSLAAVTQFGRVSTGSVSLGGNGQFTRLSALGSLGDEPWSDSLTEDLDLGLRLAIKGWVATSAPGAAVDQQAVASVRRLVRQRTRWYQGHMTAGCHIREIWRTPDLPHLRALELISYLLCPWVLDLPWAILFHVCVWGMITNQTATFLPASDLLGIPISLGFWYLLSFFPAIISGAIYHRRDQEIGLLRAMLFSHAVVVMNYLSFVCVWGGFFRILAGRKSWAKTQREAEAGAPTVARPATVRTVPADLRPPDVSTMPRLVTASDANGHRTTEPRRAAAGPRRSWEVKQAVAVAWEKLAELAGGDVTADPALLASVRLLAECGADRRLAALFAPWPGRPAASYELASFDVGDLEPGRTVITSSAAEAVQAMLVAGPGIAAILTARHDLASRVVASVDAHGSVTFSAPDLIAVDGPERDGALAAWLEVLGGQASRVAGSPVAVSPVAVSPVAVSPVAVSPVAVSPVAASPVAASPVAVSPVAASPVAVRDAASSGGGQKVDLAVRVASLAAEVRELQAEMAAHTTAPSGSSRFDRRGSYPPAGRWLLPIDVDLPQTPASAEGVG